MATSTTSPADTARAIFDAFNSHDTDAMRALWHDDVLERFPDGEVRGADALAAYFRELFGALPDAHMEIVAVAEAGSEVLLRWKLTGTHTGGAFQGIQPTGKGLAIDGVDHFTFRDGRQAVNYVVFDRMQFGQQLGMLPPDGSPGERGMKALFNARTRVAARLARARG